MRDTADSLSLFEKSGSISTQCHKVYELSHPKTYHIDQFETILHNLATYFKLETQDDINTEPQKNRITSPSLAQLK